MDCARLGSYRTPDTYYEVASIFSHGLSAVIVRPKPGREQMQEKDPELRRLKEIERLARDQLLRLSQPGTFGGDAHVIKAAEDLWREAAAAVRAHSDKLP